MGGYFAYHAVSTNGESISAFRTQVVRLWRQALRRRSPRSRLPWERVRRLAVRWTPPARIQHPWPTKRFGVTIQGKSPVRYYYPRDPSPSGTARISGKGPARILGTRTEPPQVGAAGTTVCRAEVTSQTRKRAEAPC